jgi:hypothetical protein
LFQSKPKWVHLKRVLATRVMGSGCWVLGSASGFRFLGAELGLDGLFKRSFCLAGGVVVGVVKELGSEG